MSRLIRLMIRAAYNANAKKKTIDIISASAKKG